MKLTSDKARWYEDSDGFWVAFRTKNRAISEQIARDLDGKPWDVEAKPHREKRSLDANRYFWVLLDELAAVLMTDKDELYRVYIKKMGVFRDFHLAPEEAQSFMTAWSMLGTGWISEQADFTQDGEQIVVRAYYGSSRYNTKQMSRIINEVVEACKAQGIETKTPDELALMLARWSDG